MTFTPSEEYRQLELDSSNFLMEWDAKRGLGRYEEAAVAASRAGTLRLRMGQLLTESGKFSEAAEDWLSAAAAFLRATDPERSAFALGKAQALEVQGSLPPERTDLRECLKQRGEELKHLEARIKSVMADFTAQGFEPDVPCEAALNFLLRQVRELPGLAMLHYTIARQAAGLGRQDLAGKHLFWATVFDPHNETFFAQLGLQMIATGRTKEAQHLAETFLSQHETAGWVRVMLALALASAPESGTPEMAQAVQVLYPLIDPGQADVLCRVSGLAVSAELRQALGQVEEADRLLQELAALEGAGGGAELRATISELRFVVSTSLHRSPPADGTTPSDGTTNHRLVHLVEQLMTTAA